tara:strand:+ start:84 stop:764 length:681 start_codon:yes stop_codon:yes gene_type:complete
MKKLLMHICLILILQSTSQAFISFYGPTGLLKIPTAETLNSKEYNLSSDIALNTNKNNSSLHIYAINIGLIKNTEFGILGSSNLTEGVYLNAKWSLNSYFKKIPFSTAVGIKNFPSANQSDIYIVGSKRIHKDTTIHFGNSNKFSNKLHSSLILGTLYTYKENILFAGDISSESDNKYNLSLGFYMSIFEKKFNNNLYFKGTILNLIKNSNEDSYISLGINYANFM